MSNEIADLQTSRTLPEVAAEISELKAQLLTWRSVADHYGVGVAVVWRIANDGYEPQGNDVRRRLGLEEILHIRAARNKHGRFQRRR